MQRDRVLTFWYWYDKQVFHLNLDKFRRWSWKSHKISWSKGSKFLNIRVIEYANVLFTSCGVCLSTNTVRVKSIDRVREIYHPWKEFWAIRLVKVLKLRIWTWFLFSMISKSISNNRMVGKLLVPAAFKIGSKVWVRCLRVIEGHTEGVSIWGGL